MSQIPARILPIIVISQFAGTSLWFAGNAILADLSLEMNLGSGALGWITSSVQLGFIAGTLLFAFFGVSDRFSARWLFLVFSIVGAIANGLIAGVDSSFFWVLVLRFCVGFSLAGIYPIGMKIAAGWYKGGLGLALGFLVGALVIGTAFPHLLNYLGGSLSWRSIILAVSAIAFIGGILLFVLVPDGPFISSGNRFNPRSIPELFKINNFKSAAFGYFGHMWELYAFWAFVPLMIAYYSTSLDSSLWSFIIISTGTAGCIFGGYLSLKIASIDTAKIMLAVSGLCCLMSPLVWGLSPIPFLIFLAVWGFSVVADSAQFSNAVAASIPKNLIGTGLTIVNSIGFTITIVSIELINYSTTFMDTKYVFLVLLAGPMFGVYKLQKFQTS